jgi:hypothetical protein
LYYRVLFSMRKDKGTKRLPRRQSVEAFDMRLQLLYPLLEERQNPCQLLRQ